MISVESYKEVHFVGVCVDEFDDLASIKYKEILVRNACIKCFKMHNLWLKKNAAADHRNYLTLTYHISHITLPPTC